MILDNFIVRYQNKSIGYPGGMYRGECLSLAKQYIQERHDIAPPPSGVGSAWGYWTNFPDPLGTVFERVEYETGLAPRPGDIVIWRKSGRLLNGHIAIAVTGSPEGFIGFEQNWFRRAAALVWHDYRDVYGWLTPRRD